MIEWNELLISVPHYNCLDPPLSQGQLTFQVQYCVYYFYRCYSSSGKVELVLLVFMFLNGDSVCLLSVLYSHARSMYYLLKIKVLS